MKRFVALVLAFTIIMALGSFAFAEDDVTGSITVNDVETGKYYTIYRIFGLTGVDTDDPADDEYNTASYTLDEDWVDFFIGATALGSEYLVEKTSDNASTYEKYNMLTYNGKAYFIYIGDGSDSTVNNISAFAEKALAYALVNTNGDESHHASESDETAGSYTFEGLELGYYLVHPEGAAFGTATSGSICSLTSTIPEAEVTPKASAPTIDKKINGKDGDSVDIGEVVTFTITTQVPDTAGYDEDNPYVFYLMDSYVGAKFKAGTVSIKIDGKACTVSEVESDDVFDEDDDTIVYISDDNSWWYTYEEVAVDPMNFGQIAFVANMLEWQDYVDKTIEITYKATTTEDTTLPGDGITLNEVWLFYSNYSHGNFERNATIKASTGGPTKTSAYTSESKYMNDSRIVTGARLLTTADYMNRADCAEDMVGFWSNTIEVTKVDGDSNPLENAKFVLMNSDGEFLLETLDGDGKLTGIDWVEISDSSLSSSNLSVDDATVEALKAAADADDITAKLSDDEGFLEFKGIEDGTYYLVEIEAPEGYNMLDSAQAASVAATLTTSYTFKPYGIMESDIAEITVTNVSGTILPETGGMGTTLFFVTGGMLAAAAAVLIIKKRRVNSI